MQTQVQKIPFICHFNEFLSDVIQRSCFVADDDFLTNQVFDIIQENLIYWLKYPPSNSADQKYAYEVMHALLSCNSMSHVPYNIQMKLHFLCGLIYSSGFIHYFSVDLNSALPEFLASGALLENGITYLESLCTHDNSCERSDLILILQQHLLINSDAKDLLDFYENLHSSINAADVSIEDACNLFDVFIENRCHYKSKHPFSDLLKIKLLLHTEPAKKFTYKANGKAKNIADLLFLVAFIDDVNMVPPDQQPIRKLFQRFLNQNNYTPILLPCYSYAKYYAIKNNMISEQESNFDLLDLAQKGFYLAYDELRNPVSPESCPENVLLTLEMRYFIECYKDKSLGVLIEDSNFIEPFAQQLLAPPYSLPFIVEVPLSQTAPYKYLRLLSWKILNQKQIDSIENLIQRYNPDVICLQDDFKASYEKIAGFLRGAKYFLVRFSNDLVMIINLQCINMKDVFQSCIVLNVDGRQVSIYGVNLRDENAQEYITNILKHEVNNDLSIFIGDFNCHYVNFNSYNGYNVATSFDGTDYSFTSGCFYSKKESANMLYQARSMVLIDPCTSKIIIPSDLLLTSASEVEIANILTKRLILGISSEYSSCLEFFFSPDLLKFLQQHASISFSNNVINNLCFTIKYDDSLLVDDLVQTLRLNPTDKVIHIDLSIADNLEERILEYFNKLVTDVQKCYADLTDNKYLALEGNLFEQVDKIYNCDECGDKDFNMACHLSRPLIENNTIAVKTNVELGIKVVKEAKKQLTWWTLFFTPRDNQDTTETSAVEYKSCN